MQNVTNPDFTRSCQAWRDSLLERLIAVRSIFDDGRHGEYDTTDAVLYGHHRINVDRRCQLSTRDYKIQRRYVTINSRSSEQDEMIPKKYCNQRDEKGEKLEKVSVHTIVFRQ